ncbi:hypothetical protein Cni_G02703 [Canna indica]|uniref:Myb-like domain-containing protein n=1 Tax=Canna indica TaxID=4628 RepID=A0AAQ3JQG2_9LILI|nr:hypothetical protein Cni_G02703 [Canna indica]
MGEEQEINIETLMAEDKAAQIETLVQEEKIDIVPEGPQNIMASKTDETESDAGRVEQQNEVFQNDPSRMASPSCPNDSPLKTQLNQDANGDYISRIISKEKLPMKASNTSFWYTNFLDQSHILNSGPEASLSDFQTRQLQKNLGFNNSGHKQTSIGPEMSKRQDEWSGEELDFLWIGVRRHGENNWNAILTDPQLHFLESRVAKELADKWNDEKRRMTKGSFIEPIRLPTPTNNHYSAGSTFLPRDPKLQTFREETSTRSFGDPFLYSENNSKASAPNLSGAIIAKPISCRPPPSETPYLGSTPIRSASDEIPEEKEQSSSSKRNQPWGLLMYAQNSLRMREMALKTKGRRSSVPKSVNAPVPPGPPRCSGVLKRKSVTSGDGDSRKKVRNTACIDEEWLRKRLFMSPNVGLTFQDPTSDDDTGASSEDTL